MTGLAGRSVHVQGVVYIVLSAFFYALTDVVSRFAGSEIPAMEKVLVRNLVVAVLSAGLVVRSGHGFRWKKKNTGWFLFRSLCGLVVSFGNIYAVDHMALADATILHKLSPFFVLLFSLLMLGERIDRFQGLAIVAGFVGALFVIKPGGGFTAALPAIAAVASAVALGVVYPIVRRLRQDGEDGSFIVFFFAVVSALVALPLSIGNFVMPTAGELLFLVLSGVGNCLAQLAASAAFARCPGREISVYDYSQILFAAILGYGFFRQVPDGWSVVGYVIILATSVLLFLHNRKLARD